MRSFNLIINTVGDFKEIGVLTKFDDFTYILISEKDSSDIRIEERNIYIIKGNEVINKVRLLESPFASVKPKSYVAIDESGNIYQMDYDENCDIHVYKLNMDLEYASSIEAYKIK